MGVVVVAVVLAGIVGFAIFYQYWYLPAPKETVSNYRCLTGGSSPSSSVIISFSGRSDQLNASTSHGVSIDLSGCSYVYTSLSTATRCGVMCGGGIGYIDQQSYVLKLNFSLSTGSSTCARQAEPYGIRAKRTSPDAPRSLQQRRRKFTTSDLAFHPSLSWGTTTRVSVFQRHVSDHRIAELFAADCRF